nr:FecR family protein [Mucilaginibacter sp. L294]
MDIYKLRKILQRYREGKANETESALVEAWYKSYDADEQQLGYEEAAKLREAMSGNIKAATIKRSIIYFPMFRIAASLAIVSAIGFFAWKFTRSKTGDAQNYTTVITGTKGLKQLTLPDGTVVWLNAASHIKVPVAFTGRLREVVLVEGEAFFEVKHNRLHPFIVHASAIKIQVLGTSFNVRAYKKMQTISVSVATGKVGVTGKSKIMAMLLPGQQLNYNVLDGKTEQKTIDADKVQSWKQGSTYLSQASFKELSIIIKNIYGLTLKAGNKKIENYRFSLRLIHTLPTVQVVDLISQLHHTHFRKEGNDITLY